jgi:hypothetical protein
MLVFFWGDPVELLSGREMEAFLARLRTSSNSSGDRPSQPRSPNIFFMGDRDLFCGELTGEFWYCSLGSLLSKTSSRAFVGDLVR